MIKNKKASTELTAQKIVKILIGLGILIVVLLIFFSPLSDMVKDIFQATSKEPDCGMRTKSSNLGILSPERGRTYSSTDKIKFQANPEEYCTIDSYEWKLDKKTISREESFEYTIDEKGKHKVTLKIEYNNGNIEEWESEIIIN